MSAEIKKQKILIIDDAIANIKILASILKPDYKILSSLDAREAIDIAFANKPDLILLDIMMPGIDGYEVCRRLKADERTRNIPVIFITARTGDEDEAKGFEVGAVDYIIKPFGNSVVKARVKTHLSLRTIIVELKNALENVKLLSGMLPICTSCKKVRDDGGYWQQIESYISQHSEAEFSHSLCPECLSTLYPNLKRLKPQHVNP
jgi:PleD family two-component response regulator